MFELISMIVWIYNNVYLRLKYIIYLNRQCLWHSRDQLYDTIDIAHGTARLILLLDYTS